MAKVLITGAGSPLGQVFAKRFAEKGWDLLLHGYRSIQKLEQLAEALQKQCPISIQVFSADFTQKEGFDRLRQDLDSAAGTVDVLVNNAAILPERHRLIDVPPAVWEEVMQMNTWSILQMTQLYVQYLSPGSGRIVNIASLGSFEIWKERGLYNLSKNAVFRMTQILAVELAPHYTVNAVAPGFVASAANVQEFQIDKRKIPMQRYGQPEDVWDAVYFFATCSDYITGQSIIVDGGLHLAKGCV